MSPISDVGVVEELQQAMFEPCNLGVATVFCSCTAASAGRTDQKNLDSVQRHLAKIP